jgi:hypothetical protein
MYNGFIDINLLHVSFYKRPSSGKYTLLTHSQTIELREYICRSIIIITNTLDFHNIKLLNIISYVSRKNYMLLNVYECHTWSEI